MAGLLHKERGGLRIGDFNDIASLNVSWPGASLQVFTGLILIKSMLGSDMQFSKEDVSSIELHKGIFSKGIRIIHNKANEKNFIVFWSFNIRKLMKILLENGWPVKEEEKPKDDKDGMWLKA
jgi:hypothetical protein